MAETTKATEAKAEPVVAYTGSATEAKISAAQWATAGVTGQLQVAWNKANRFQVKASDLNKDALEVLKQDSRFKLPE